MTASIPLQLFDWAVSEKERAIKNTRQRRKNQAVWAKNTISLAPLPRDRGGEALLIGRIILVGQAGEVPAGQVQGVVGGLGPQAGPDGPVAQLQGADIGAAGSGDGHKHGAHLVATVVLVRAGHAGGGQGDVAAQDLAGTFRHGLGHLGGDGPMLVQQLLGDPQHPGLHLVGVGDHAALEHLGGARDVGDTLGDEAAGATLGGAQGQVFLLQKGQHHFLQGGHVHTVDLGAEELFDLLHRGLQESLGLGVGGGLGGDPQLALPLLGVGGQGGVGHGVHLHPELGFHGGLPDAEELQGVGGDDPLGQGLEVGHGPVAEHGAALAGGAGEHDDVDPLGLEGAAGGGAPVVGQHGAALGEHGLLEVVLRHGAAGAGEVAGDAVGGPLVKDQLFPKSLGQHVFGQVVAGGAQAAGGDDDVGPLFGDGHGLLGPLGVVPHHGVVVDVQPQLAQTLGQHLGVRVGDVAQQQLGAHGQDFNGVRHGKDLQREAEQRFTGILF